MKRNAINCNLIESGQVRRCQLLCQLVIHLAVELLEVRPECALRHTLLKAEPSYDASGDPSFNREPIPTLPLALL